MVVELENLNTYRRNCKKHKERPKDVYNSFLASPTISHISPSIGGFSKIRISTSLDLRSTF
jgi:hypothetical protein